MKKKSQIQLQQFKNLNKYVEKHVNNFAVHHIHVKYGDEFFTIAHRGGFVEASELMDQLVKYIIKGFELDDSVVEKIKNADLIGD